LILAIDQGTTGTTCLVVDDELRVAGRGYCRVPQTFPQPGWVEQEPDDILSSVEAAAAAALLDADLSAGDLDAIGLANQRETSLVWDRRSGIALHKAIVWQDRRTAERCRALPEDLIRERTGLVPDPYFSATKLEWLLAAIGPDVARRHLACGTVDTWLLSKLTEGACYVTDVSNASRTLLLNLGTLGWDDELLALFGIERELLPAVTSSSGVVGEALLGGRSIPVAGVAGDQQAALLGQACLEPGQGKATYGTGGFVLVNAGAERPAAPAGLLLTLAAQTGPDRPAYALEGSILSVGAALEWLAEGLQLIASPAESDLLARSVPDTDGVYFVPALTGLGSPYWAPDARGTVCGLTRGTRREHLVRAALEAIAHQTRDVLDRMPFAVTALRVDGGVTANEFAMQFLSDLLGIPVEVSAEPEATALGAAALAAVGIGVWTGPDALAAHWSARIRYEPAMTRDEADSRHLGWTKAVERSLN
jgi:glycerol kinase